MRRQDELLALYPGQDRFNRKFILGELESATDSDEVLELIQREILVGDPVIAHQAQVAASRFLPAFLHRRHGVGLPREPGWMFRTGGETGEDLARAREALGPAVRLLAPMASGKNPPVRVLSRMALSRFPAPPVCDALIASVTRDPTDFDAVLALLAVSPPGRLSGLADDAGSWLLDQAQGAPDLALLVSAAGALPPTDALVRAIATLDGRGRVNLAQSLSRASLPDPGPITDALLASAEGWVQIHVLDILAASGSVREVTRVRAIYEHASHGFVRRHAIRTAGALGGQQARELALRGLGSEDEATRAQALESLARAGCPPDELARAARPLLASGDVRVRTNAILAMGWNEETHFMPVLKDLLLSNDAGHRLEAAYALGFWQSPRALEVLRTLAVLDPDPAVAVQAIRSLTRSPSERVVPILVDLARTDTDRRGLVAARAIPTVGMADPESTLETLSEALGQTRARGHRTRLLRALGAVCGRSGRPSMHPRLVAALEDPDPVVVVAALEAGKVQAQSVPTDLTPLLQVDRGDEHPRIAVKARTLAFLNGAVEAFDGIEVGFAADPAVRSGLLSSVLELGMILQIALPAGLYPRLRSRLAPDSAPAEAAVDREAPPASRSASLAGSSPGSGGDDEGFSSRSGAADAGSDLDLGSLAAHLSRARVQDVPDDHRLSQQIFESSYRIDPGLPDPLEGPDPEEGAGHPVDPARTGTGRVDGPRGGDITRSMTPVGPGGPDPDPNATPPTGIPRSGPPARWVIDRRALGGVLAAILLAVGVAASGRPGRSLDPRRAEAFRVIRSEGSPFRRPGDVPVELGGGLQVGMTLVTGREDRVRLVNPQGGRVEVEGAGTIRIESVGRDWLETVVRLEPASMRIDFRHGGALEALVGPERYRMEGALVEIVDPMAPRLAVREGRVRRTGGTGEVQWLEAGASTPLIARGN